MDIKVVVIEDHKPLRESLAYMLSNTEGFKLAGSYHSMEQALDNDFITDIVLLDINLPGISGIEGLPILKDKYKDIKVIILTVFEDYDNIFKAILNGADGYLLKRTPPIRLLQFIEDAAIGGSPMTPEIAKKTLELFRRYAPKKDKEFFLTKREIEILSLLVEGNNSDDIANSLFISIQTVRNHIRHIYEKLHVHSKSQAVIKAIREGII